MGCDGAPVLEPTLALSRSRASRLLSTIAHTGRREERRMESSCVKDFIPFSQRFDKTRLESSGSPSAPIGTGSHPHTGRYCPRAYPGRAEEISGDCLAALCHLSVLLIFD